MNQSAKRILSGILCIILAITMSLSCLSFAEESVDTNSYDEIITEEVYSEPDTGTDIVSEEPIPEEIVENESIEEAAEGISEPVYSETLPVISEAPVAETEEGQEEMYTIDLAVDSQSSVAEENTDLPIIDLTQEETEENAEETESVLSLSDEPLAEEVDLVAQPEMISEIRKRPAAALKSGAGNSGAINFTFVTTNDYYNESTYNESSSSALSTRPYFLKNAGGQYARVDANGVFQEFVTSATPFMYPSNGGITITGLPAGTYNLELAGEDDENRIFAQNNYFRVEHPNVITVNESDQNIKIKYILTDRDEYLYYIDVTGKVPEVQLFIMSRTNKGRDLSGDGYLFAATYSVSTNTNGELVYRFDPEGTLDYITLSSGSRVNLKNMPYYAWGTYEVRYQHQDWTRLLASGVYTRVSDSVVQNGTSRSGDMTQERAMLFVSTEDFNVYTYNKLGIQPTGSESINAQFYLTSPRQSSTQTIPQKKYILDHYNTYTYQGTTYTNVYIPRTETKDLSYNGADSVINTVNGSFTLLLPAGAHDAFYGSIYGLEFLLYEASAGNGYYNRESPAVAIYPEYSKPQVTYTPSGAPLQNYNLAYLGNIIGPPNVSTFSTNDLAISFPAGMTARTQAILNYKVPSITKIVDAAGYNNETFNFDIFIKDNGSLVKVGTVAVRNGQTVELSPENVPGLTQDHIRSGLYVKEQDTGEWILSSVTGDVTTDSTGAYTFSRYPTQYDTTQPNMTFTNTPATTNIKKIWEDAGHESQRPSSINISVRDASNPDVETRTLTMTSADATDSTTWERRYRTGDDTIFVESPISRPGARYDTFYDIEDKSEAHTFVVQLDTKYAGTDVSILYLGDESVDGLYGTDRSRNFHVDSNGIVRIPYTTVNGNPPADSFHFDTNWFYIRHVDINDVKSVTLSSSTVDDGFGSIVSNNSGNSSLFGMDGTSSRDIGKEMTAKAWRIEWRGSIEPFAGADVIINRYKENKITKAWEDTGYVNERPSSIEMSVRDASSPNTVLNTVTMTSSDAVDGTTWEHAYDAAGETVIYESPVSGVHNTVYNTFYDIKDKKDANTFVIKLDDSYAGTNVRIMYPSNYDEDEISTYLGRTRMFHVRDDGTVRVPYFYYERAGTDNIIEWFYIYNIDIGAIKSVTLSKSIENDGYGDITAVNNSSSDFNLSATYSRDISPNSGLHGNAKVHWNGSIDSFAGADLVTNQFTEKTEVVISKTDFWGNEIAGAGLVLQGRELNASSNIVPITWTSGSDGRVNESDPTSALKPHTVQLKPGTYTLQESTTPSGYQHANDITFTVGSDFSINIGNTTVNRITMVDEPTKVVLPVVKMVTGSYRNITSNFKLTLWKEEGSTVIPFSGYTVYNANGNQPVGVTDANGQITFSLQTTASSTSAYIPLFIPIGCHYSVEEISCSETDCVFGYSQVGSQYSASKKVEGVAASSNPNPIFTNIEKKPVPIKKSDGNGHFVPGAVLQVLDDAGNILKEWTTGNSTETVNLVPNINNNYLPDYYVLHEKTVPTGYKGAPDIRFTVVFKSPYDGSVVMVPYQTEDNLTTLEMVDIPLHDVAISKQDINGNVIPGAGLRITGREDGASSDITPITFTSGTDGKTGNNYNPHTVKLAPGTYTLTETSVPSGYVQASPITFTVDSAGVIKIGTTTVSRIEMRDEYVVHDLTVKKTVSGNMGSRDKNFSFKLKLKMNNTAFAGKQITTIKNGVTGTATTNASGEVIFTLGHNDTIIFKNLMYSTTYEVTETNYASEGYKTTYSNNATGTMGLSNISVNVTNTRSAIIQTSVQTKAVSAAFAVLMAALAACIVLLFRHLGRREH